MPFTRSNRVNNGLKSKLSAIQWSYDYFCGGEVLHHWATGELARTQWTEFFYSYFQNRTLWWTQSDDRVANYQMHFYPHSSLLSHSAKRDSFTTSQQEQQIEKHGGIKMWIGNYLIFKGKFELETWNFVVMLVSFSAKNSRANFPLL